MKQIGRMTLFEVVELADDLSTIRVDCLREFAKLDSTLDIARAMAAQWGNQDSPGSTP